MDRSIANLEQFFGQLYARDMRASRGVRITFILPEGGQQTTILRLQE